MRNSAVSAIRSQKEKAQEQERKKEERQQEELEKLCIRFNSWLQGIEPMLSSEIARHSADGKWELVIWEFPTTRGITHSKSLLSIASAFSEYARSPLRNFAELREIFGTFLKDNYEENVNVSYCMEGKNQRITLWWGEEEPKRSAL